MVWGASGHALVVADILRCLGLDIAAFIDDVNASRQGESFADARVIVENSEIERLRDDGVRHGIVAVGANPARMQLADRLDRIGIEVISAVHPSATIADSAVLGAGTVVAAGAVIGVAARLGRCVIVNTAATVDHECVLEDGVHVSPGGCIAGRVRVGAATWIGAGATVVDGITIGSRTVVGAGAAVIADLPSGVTAVGVPARVIKTVQC
jgi:sugar O-acyltransferase (sialic acid O-acetyltransferase NeuD family)